MSSKPSIMVHASPIIMLVVIRVNMMKLKAKYHGSCKSNSNARSYTRKYDEAQSQVSWFKVQF